MSAEGIFNAGDAFRDASRTVDIHLWIIISDPHQDPSRVLIVSLTTYKPYKDQACRLQRGDHQAIRHDTCVAYNLAKMTTIARLEEARDEGLILRDVPVTSEILTRIREGAALSKRMAIEHFELLEAQGLV